jgi:hypothetical protein
MRYGLIEALGEVRLHDDDGSNYVGLNAPSTIASNFSLFFPGALPPSTSFLNITSSGVIGYSSAVTSVGLSAPSIFTVSGSPVTASGTLALALQTQAAGTVFSGPVSGGNAAPTFRPLEITDFSTLPTLDDWGPAAANINLNGFSIVGLANPTDPTDAANKAYVDAAIQGLRLWGSVRYATVSNIASILTASASVIQAALDVVGGVAPTLQIGDRVLVKDQTTASQNGKYTWDGTSLVRSSDADEASEFGPGSFVFVEEGDNLGDSGWVMSSDSPFTLGTSDANFTQFSGAGQLVAGSGLTKTGNTLNVQTASSSRIVVNADNIDLATTAVTAGTYTSVTVDSYGRVTNGTNPVTVTSDTQTFDNSDLVAGLLSVVHPLNKKYVSVILTDNTDRIFVPDQVLYIDTDELQIDMTSFGTITGTYTLTLLA